MIRWASSALTFRGACRFSPAEPKESHVYDALGRAAAGCHCPVNDLHGELTVPGTSGVRDRAPLAAFRKIRNGIKPAVLPTIED